MADDPFWPGIGPHWGPSIPVSGLALEQDVYRRCMTFKGYALVKDQPGLPARHSASKGACYPPLMTTPAPDRRS
jgi:hypothetical protein